MTTLLAFLRTLGIGAVRCAWCPAPGRLLGLRIGQETSHGICAACQRQHFAEYA